MCIRLRPVCFSSNTFPHYILSALVSVIMPNFPIRVHICSRVSLSINNCAASAYSRSFCTIWSFSAPGACCVTLVWEICVSFPLFVSFSSQGAFLFLSFGCPICASWLLGCAVFWVACLLFLSPYGHHFLVLSLVLLAVFVGMMRSVLVVVSSVRGSWCRLLCGMFDVAFPIARASCISI